MISSEEKIESVVVTKTELRDLIQFGVERRCEQCFEVLEINDEGNYNIPEILAVDSSDSSIKGGIRLSLKIPDRSQSNTSGALNNLKQYSLMAVVIEHSSWFEVAVFHKKS